MTPLISYAVIAILTIIIVVLFARSTRLSEPEETTYDEKFAQDLRGGAFLNLSERIFDSADYFWVRDVLGFRRLARSLAQSRKRLAIQWLRTLKAGFDELVRTPDSTLSDGKLSERPGSWRLLWLALRVHFLLTYALFMVRLFGPYTRLIPSSNWRRLLPEWSQPAQLYSTAELRRFR